MGIDSDVLRCYTVPTVERRLTEKASNNLLNTFSFVRPTPIVFTPY